MDEDRLLTLFTEAFEAKVADPACPIDMTEA